MLTKLAVKNRRSLSQETFINLRKLVTKSMKTKVQKHENSVLSAADSLAEVVERSHGREHMVDGSPVRPLQLHLLLHGPDDGLRGDVVAEVSARGGAEGGLPARGLLLVLVDGEHPQPVHPTLAVTVPAPETLDSWS